LPSLVALRDQPRCGRASHQARLRTGVRRPRA